MYESGEKCDGQPPTETQLMSETTDANGDPIQDGKQYRLDYSTGELVPVEEDDEE